ncbi:MAG: hypothetical protein LBS40_06775 [Burkholderiales bacterium]|jgi:hypothetical protein|nr:hypothetical protein [Burkholderiales bacterium]
MRIIVFLLFLPLEAVSNVNAASQSDESVSHAEYRKIIVVTIDNGSSASVREEREISLDKERNCIAMCEVSTQIRRQEMASLLSLSDARVMYCGVLKNLCGRSLISEMVTAEHNYLCQKVEANKAIRSIEASAESERWLVYHTRHNRLL